MKSKISFLLALSMFSLFSFFGQAHAETYPELCSVLSRTLQQGDTGEDVKRLQIVLGQEGVAYLGATGYFGPQTKAAVKIFQSRAGIYAVGKVGPQTLARMRALWCQGTGGNDYPGNGGGYPPINTGSDEVTIAPLNSSGDVVTISWSSRNTNSCQLNNQPVQTAGTQQFKMYGESNFTISCTTINGRNIQKTITVRPNQDLTRIPTLDLTINPMSAIVGTYATMSWVSTNTQYCTLTGGNFSASSIQTSGSQQIYVSSIPTNYTVTCFSPNGPIAKTISSFGTQIISGVPTVSLVASNPYITSGGATNITWTSTNANSCTISNNTGTGSTYQGVSGTQTVYPTVNTVYTISCIGQNGQSVTAQTAVYVTNNGCTSNCGLTAKISANYTSINAGQGVTLNWYSSGANSCSLSGGNIYSSNQNTSGTYLVYPNTTTNYFLTCTGQNGQTVTDQVNIIVNGQNSNAPTVTLNASTNNIYSGQPVTLSWTSTNASSCTLIGNGLNINVGTNANYIVYPTTSANYYVNCNGYYGGTGTSNQVTITIGGSNTGTDSLSANPSSGQYPLTVNFTGNVTSGGYDIDYGDGTAVYYYGCAHGGCPINSSATINVNHTYSNVGTYTVKLRRHANVNAGNCSGADCNVVATTVITVTNQTGTTPTVTLSANPTSVNVNQASTLTWTSTNATSCTLNGGSYSNYQTGTSGSISVIPGTSNQTYTINCSNGSYSASDVETVNVVNNTASSFTVSPATASINAGQSVVITLSKNNVTACKVNGGGYLNFAVGGDTITVTPTANSTTYTFTCTGSSGAAITKTSVITKVTTPITASVKVSPVTAIISPNQTVNLVLTKTNINTCSVTGPNITNSYLGTANSIQVTPTGNSQYVFNCLGINNKMYYATSTLTTLSTSVNVTPATSTITVGQSVTLTLNKNNIISCTISGGAYNNTSVGNTISVSPTTTTTYNFNCLGNDNSTQTTSSTITVGNGTGPSLTLTPASSTIAYGGNQIVTISKININYCYLFGPGYNNSIYNDNTFNITNATSSKTFTLNCYGNDGTLVSKNIQINIDPTSIPPAISITPSVATVTASSVTPVSFTLNKTNINYCYVTGNSAGSTMNNTFVNSNPFAITVNPVVTTAYTFTCTGNNGSNVSTTTRIIVQ